VNPTPPPAAPVRFLHGARPDGTHFWAAFVDAEQFRRQIERLSPYAPADVSWDVTADTVGWRPSTEEDER
jgi:hypothetical protein